MRDDFTFFINNDRNAAFADRFAREEFGNSSQPYICGGRADHLSVRNDRGGNGYAGLAGAANIVWVAYESRVGVAGYAALQSIF